MAAPTDIVWGDIAYHTNGNSAGRLGIYTNVTTSGSTATVSIEVWFYSKWSVDDSTNTLYFNDNASTATTSIGSVTIDHTVATGSGWSASNQTKVYSNTFTHARTSSAKTIYCAAKLTGIEAISKNTVMVSTSYTIPAISTYTVSYNANGGTGAPSSQTKMHDTALTLSTTKPTRNGYAFAGWSTSSSATSATYSAGGTYAANASVTLYAVWTSNGYTVSYNANGGTGVPVDQTKVHGTTLTLSSITPTRNGYDFVGWGVSSTSTTASYQPGGRYTQNAPITLYAIWTTSYIKPTITSLTVIRTNSAGTADEEGTYFKVSFDWTTNSAVTSIKVRWTVANTTNWSQSTITASGTSGNVSKVLGSNIISTESTYTVEVTVSDSGGSTTLTRTLGGTAYSIDFLSGGKGVAIGKQAEFENTFDVNLTETKLIKLTCANYAQFKSQATFEDQTFFDKAVNVSGALTANDILLVDKKATFNDEVSATFLRVAGSAAFNSHIFDAQGKEVTNGLAVYNTSTHPDNTTDHLLLTSTGTPNGSLMYIETNFYSEKTASSNRMQVAYPYSGEGPLYYRYYNGSWSTWRGFGSSKYVTNGATSVATGEIWTNNKPIYRKVITYSLTQADTLVTLSTTISDLGTLVRMTGNVLRASKYRPLDFYYSSGDYNLVTINTSGTIQVRASAACTYTIIVEYTRS